MATILGKTLYTLGDSIYFLTDAKTWDAAQAEARSYAGTAGNLVTINNSAEQIFLAGLFANVSPWIGFSDADSEGTFKWISGETTTYAPPWNGGEPNNGGGLNNEDYVAIGGNTSWFDVRGTDLRQGIVEIKNSNVPIFVIEDLGIIEPATGTKQVLFTVKRYGKVNTAVTIDYSTQNDTALAGQDYQATSGQLSFSSGETSKTIAVNIFKDADTISKEKFFVNLTGISGNGVLGRNQAVGTIRETSEAVTFGDKTYLLTANAGNWGQAQAEAQTYGGNLVTINDVLEQNFLGGLYAAQNAWIGYSDAGKEGIWEWFTDPNAYSNWNGGEPNNGGGLNNEDRRFKNEVHHLGGASRKGAHLR